MKKHFPTLIKHLFFFLSTISATQMHIPPMSWTEYSGASTYPNSSKIFLTKKNSAVNHTVALYIYSMNKTFQNGFNGDNHGFPFPI